MERRKFTMAVAKKVLRMLEGGFLPSSALPRWFVEELRSEGLLAAVTHGSRISYRVTDTDACIRFIMDKYTSGTSLERWIEAVGNGNEDIERSTLVQDTGNSKSVKLRTFRGFLVNCFVPIDARIGDSDFLISPVGDTAVFIQNPDRFRISSDVVVVGIENGENFRHIRRQKHLFGDRKVLFVSRYPQSSDLRDWLKSISNEYIHFGDFDLAGISIYQSEFYKYLGSRASFLVPADIEERLQKGNATLYDKQYLRYKDMEVADSRLLPLVGMIHRYRKVYEQEGYII